MNNITFYKPNGYIFAVLSGDAPVIDATKATSDDLWIVGAWNGATHYVKNGEAEPRPANPAVLDNLTLRNLPVPCKIVINSSVYECDDTEVELDLPMAGNYFIQVKAFPYLDAEFQIET
jgi:hypothetical protein